MVFSKVFSPTRRRQILDNTSADHTERRSTDGNSTYRRKPLLSRTPLCLCHSDLLSRAPRKATKRDHTEPAVGPGSTSTSYYSNGKKDLPPPLLSSGVINHSFIVHMMS